MKWAEMAEDQRARFRADLESRVPSDFSGGSLRDARMIRDEERMLEHEAYMRRQDEEKQARGAKEFER